MFNLEISGTKIVALYLPQYYETSYNDEWWGKGYTEWTACKAAKPLFRGHCQPRVPLNDWYYDLSLKYNIKKQIDLAKKYGIDGFAIYQYYSCGKKLLDVPTEMIRDNRDLDIPFFLFWANESWKKAWFGQDNTVVWAQEYGGKKEWKKQYEYCRKFFHDSRYMCIDEKPIYAIYNAWNFSRVDEFISYWNELAKADGFPEIYFIKAQGSRDNKNKGKFSAIVTREPNYTFAQEKIIKKITRIIKTRVIEVINTYFLLPKGKGIVRMRVSYDVIWKQILSRRDMEGAFLGAFVAWDNSPRKSYNATVRTGATPEKFGEYMCKLMKKAQEIHSPVIVINAWNEWAEGAFLEPDKEYGTAYLEQISKFAERKSVYNGRTE